MNETLERIATILNKLAIQANHYDQTNAIPELAKKALFEQQLFKSQSRQLIHYVNESQTLLTHVNSLIESGNSKSIIAFQCDKLVDQCQAIKKALSSQDQRTQNYQIDKVSKAKHFQNKQQNKDDNFKWLAQKIMGNSQKLYQELSKHHEYRQRFQVKIQQLHNTLDNAPMSTKMSIQHEILQLQKRLGQCNKAIYFIEQKIENVEKGKRPF